MRLQQSVTLTPPATPWPLADQACVKALSEPAIDRCQQLASLGCLPSTLPQATQAHGGTEFQGLGLLVTSHSEGMVKTACCLDLIWGALLQQQRALEPMQLGLPEMLLQWSPRYIVRQPAP